MTAGEAFVRSLKDEGVEVIFGYPGGAVLPIYDMLYSADIDICWCGMNKVAAFVAEGYARATGKPASLPATSGPGATNLVTPIADAYMDSIPRRLLYRKRSDDIDRQPTHSKKPTSPGLRCQSPSTTIS